jgi:site-specific DNA recombinase
MKNIINIQHKDSYIIYTRKSTDDANNQKNSIEYQVGEGVLYAQKNNIKIAELSIEGFCTDGIIREKHSGYKQDEGFEILENNQIIQKVERPKFLKLLSLLKTNQVKGVICLCWDRISRNEGDDILIKKLIGMGIDFRFVQVNYDATSSGALHMDIDGMFSRHYSRVISEKVTNATRKLRSQGRCTYRAPIGYLNQGSDNKPLDPDTAPLIKKMFEMYATGEWGIIPLTRWANDNGIVCQPRRRKRTLAEQLSDIEISEIPKTTRPLSKHGVEEILKNQFYIGKVKDRGIFINGIHPPLIDAKLFFKVQEVMSQKTTIKHKPYLDFFTYRGLVRCPECKRLFCTYEQKGISYMALKCKPGCNNTIRNIRESDITLAVKELLTQISFTDEELYQLEIDAEKQLNKVTRKRDEKMENAHIKMTKLMKDLDYLCKEKISFLRDQVMTIDEVKNEESRLRNEIEHHNAIIQANTESSQKMLEYIISFSELIRNASLYFEYALDTEKREIVNQIFSELYFSDKGIEYKAKQGFDTLFARNNLEVAPYGAA